MRWRCLLCALFAAVLLPGCDDAPPEADRELLRLATPAPRERPAGRLATADLWQSKRNPWNGFAAGSWVVYRLPGGVQERHLLQTAADPLIVVVQVRQPDATDWGSEQLRLELPAGAWPRVDPLRSSARVDRGMQRVAGFELELLVVRAASQELWLSSQVPGGVVRESERVGQQPRVLRELLAYGVAK